MSDPTAGRLFAPAIYRFPDDPSAWLPWSRADGQLREARNYWIVTASPDAVPHTTPIWAVWLDSTFYASGFPTARWSRNLKANPRVSVHLESAEDVVIVDGLADAITTDAELGDRIVTDWMRKYGELAPEPVHEGLYRIRPVSARAWSRATLDDGTRYVFQ